MSFMKVAQVTDIPSGSKKKVDVNGKPIMIANIGGAFFTLSDKCPHMGGSLSNGVLEDNIITCPNHGARFDVTTGKNAGNAKLAFLKMKVADATSFHVKIEGSDILVDLG